MNDQIRHDNSIGKGHIFRGSAMPIAGGWGPVFRSFLGSLPTLVWFDLERPNSAITAQGPRLQNDQYCVEWVVKL